MPPAGLLDQRVQVGQGAELGVHAGVVADVVAPVLVGRRHGRRQPDAVDPEPGQVVQPLDDAAQVAVAVTVGVQPGPDVELVKHRAVPPRGGCVRLFHLRRSWTSIPDRRSRFGVEELQAARYRRRS